MTQSTPEQIAAAFDAGTLTVDTPGLDEVSGAWGAFTYLISGFVGSILLDIQNAGEVAGSLYGGS